MLLFPPGCMPNGPQLDTKKALILLDLQNDFIRADGGLPADGVSAFLPKLPNLVDRFRQKGEIVWASTEYQGPCLPSSLETGGFIIFLKQFIRNLPGAFNENTSGYPTPRTEDDGSQAFSEHIEPTVEPDPEAFLAAEIPKPYRRCCIRGTSGCEYPDILASAIDRQKDIVTVKNQYSAFADMSLVLQLRTRMVTDLYICGSLSNISIYATVLDAVRHGFQVTLIEDCLGYRDQKCHVEAIRQMADNMCADGIDYQELMDDLAGLLGDVIKEESYTTKFQVDVSRPSLGQRTRSAQHVDDWIASIETPSSKYESHMESGRRPPEDRPSSSESNQKDDSSREGIRQISPGNCSPPRKRSTNDIDDPEDSPNNKSSQKPSVRRSSHDAHGRPNPKVKKSKPRVRRSTRERSDDSARQYRLEAEYPRSASDSSDGPTSPDTPEPSPSEMSTPVLHQRDEDKPKKKSNKKTQMVFLGPEDSIGDGTSQIINSVLDDELATRVFEKLKCEVIWQKMYHRSGEVPRLVAVQGDVVTSSVDNSSTFPIYRHPADESPELLPFDETVEALRQVCEKRVGHTLNHVLIQHYRNGEDNISEHSDKTLDIVYGSNIVNLSLGAMRTMTLRTKRAGSVKASGENPELDHSAKPRLTQRVHLAHNSLFILSPTTNASYLHAIRADKRPTCEKSSEELAFDGERISLTFRHIGTFITSIPDQSRLIWGQGATSKSREGAKPILETQHLVNGKPESTAQAQGEEMIIGFGKENHEGADFDWNGIYGKGFDVLNFAITTQEI